MPNQSVFLPSVCFCFPFPCTKCPKYCSFLSCIVLRSVCFALPIFKTNFYINLSVQMRYPKKCVEKSTSQKHWFYPPSAYLVAMILRHTKRWKVQSTLPDVLLTLSNSPSLVSAEICSDSSNKSLAVSDICFTLSHIFCSSAGTSEK